MLTGGPNHDFAGTAPALADIMAEATSDIPALSTTIVVDPAAFFAELREAHRGDREPWNLVTVYALRWRMKAERFARQRGEWAYDIVTEDALLLQDHVHNGGGLLALHTAVICFDAEPSWRALVGAAWDWQRSSHPEVGDARVDCADAAATHPITKGIEPFTICDEIYGFLDELDGIEPLLMSSHGGRSHPLLWARQFGAGRVVTNLLGHGAESLALPNHRELLRRSAAWAVGEL